MISSSYEHHKVYLCKLRLLWCHQVAIYGNTVLCPLLTEMSLYGTWPYINTMYAINIWIFTCQLIIFLNTGRTTYFSPLVYRTLGATPQEPHPHQHKISTRSPGASNWSWTEINTDVGSLKGMNIFCNGRNRYNRWPQNSLVVFQYVHKTHWYSSLQVLDVNPSLCLVWV